MTVDDDRLKDGDIVIAYKDGKLKVYFVGLDELIDYLQQHEQEFYFVVNYFDDGLRVYSGNKDYTEVQAA